MKKKSNNDIYTLIEGSDFAGKSTVANELARISDKPLLAREGKLSKINCNILGYMQLKKKEQACSDNVLFRLLQAAATNDIENYEQELSGALFITRDKIQVSNYLLRYYAIFAERGLCSFHLKEIEILLKERYPRPKHSFYLYAEIDERIARLENRKKNPNERISSTDKLLETDRGIERFIRMESFLRELSNELYDPIPIDTTGKNVFDVAEEIKLYIDHSLSKSSKDLSLLSLQ